jgi:hypothetical protein
MLDKFVTPIKCALSALQEKGDAFSIPSEQARNNAQKDFSEDSRLEVLQITSVLSVAKLKELVEAVRERCVDSGENGEKVLKNMEFMTNVHKVNNKKSLLAMLSRLLDLALKSVNKFDFAWLVLDGETVPFRRQKKILVALADRAVDLAVISTLNGAGLGADEEPDWAGVQLLLLLSQALVGNLFLTSSYHIWRPTGSASLAIVGATRIAGLASERDDCRSESCIG